jgi:hypothetical protein
MGGVRKLLPIPVRLGDERPNLNSFFLALLKNAAIPTISKYLWRKIFLLKTHNLF